MSIIGKKSRLERAAGPALAAVFAAGAAIAAVGESGDSGYAGTVEKMSRREAAAHAAILFERADLDRSGDLGADEFLALSVVTAELARLNGFATIGSADGTARAIPIATVGIRELAAAERARIEAVASRRFHTAAGENGRIGLQSFVAFELSRFDHADQNGDGELRRRELADYGEAVASAAARPTA